MPLTEQEIEALKEALQRAQMTVSGLQLERHGYVTRAEVAEERAWILDSEVRALRKALAPHDE